jgi:tetratricopeptide (TPR) repeat protein
MARRLSEITRGAGRLAVVVGVLLGAGKAVGQESGREAAAAPVIIENPFSRGVKAPAGRVTQTRPPGHTEAVYRNPFAAGAAAPPIEIPLLPGPLSRWRRSSPPVDEPSAVKRAIISAGAIRDLQIPWDVVPPAETLREQALLKSGAANSPAVNEFADPPDPARFAATPLAQPAWLNGEPDRSEPASAVGHVSFDEAIVQRPLQGWSGNAAQPARGDSSGVVIAEFDNTAEGWLAQAQQAAATARTLDELSAVVGLCQRGLAERPTAEPAGGMRRLAAWAHNRRGELLADAGRQQEAADEFDAAISLDAHCALAMHNRGVTRAQQNQLEAALGDFNRVIELNPGLAIAYRNRAELLAALGRMNEAVADYSRALESLPDDAELHAARANAWQRLGELDRARTDLDRALEIAPDQPEFLTQRGNLCAEHGQYDKALADLRRTIALAPNSAEAHRSLAWLHATCADDRYRDAARALSAAGKAVELAAPGDSLALEALAAAHAAAGEFDEAVDAQRKAIAGAAAERVAPAQQRLALYQAAKPLLIQPMSRADSGAAAPQSAWRPSPRSR